MTTAADSPKRILHPQDRATLHRGPGQVAIPKSDSLWEMVERFSVQPMARRRSDEKESALPLTITCEHGRAP